MVGAWLDDGCKSVYRLVVGSGLLTYKMGRQIRSS